MGMCRVGLGALGVVADVPFPPTTLLFSGSLTAQKEKSD
jgi:hypothetical protein